MYKFLVSFLFLFTKDPETVHRLSLLFLRMLASWPFSTIAKLCTRVHSKALSQKVFGIHFENPTGLGAGFDKEGQAIGGLAALGFGFIEVGTVTSHAQPGNPRQRIFRIPQDKAVINRMGFNNIGAEEMNRRLLRVSRWVPLGISLGKSKVTELANADDDYLFSFSLLYERGDYFVINVSSPNTPDLRKLQDKGFLVSIIGRLNQYRQTQKIKKPLLVKIDPDLDDEALKEVIHSCLEHHIDGIIAVNTTLSRAGLSNPSPEAGGLSGKPIQKRATEIIRRIHAQAPDMPIIGGGGIFTAEDAYEKIKAGASLVQIYTGFIYEGPFVVRRINKGLLTLLKRDGFKNISEAVGVETLTTPAA